MASSKIEVVSGADTTLRRMVIVRDVASFWYDDEPVWTAEGVAQIMEFCDLRDQGPIRRPVLLVGNPRVLLSHQLAAHGYAEAWEEWMQGYISDHGTCSLTVWRYGSGHSRKQTRFGDQTAACRYDVRMYEADHFSRGGLAVDVTHDSLLDDGWIRLIREGRTSLPELAMADHTDKPEKLPLTTYFASGRVVAADAEGPLANRYVQEVVIISGQAGNLRADAFLLKRQSELHQPM